MCVCVWEKSGERRETQNNHTHTREGGGGCEGTKERGSPIPCACIDHSFFISLPIHTHQSFCRLMHHTSKYPSTGPLKGTGVWKLPTGLLDVGEDLGAGAEREVKEETGITAR